MFIICREGHLGMYWEGSTAIFLEQNTAIFPSRKSCLRYLVEECNVPKEQASSAIMLMQKTKTWISF